MNIQTPYLDAIQGIPGATPGEKYKWIAKVVKERLAECNSLEGIIESEKIPQLLMPLVQAQAAQMLIKKDPKNMSIYTAIAEALKSEDATIVNKALQASSFFDGTNKTITNVRYFFDHLFPYVTLNTRLRIIKTLAIRLAPKESALAEEFFIAVAGSYGLEQALPLLPACSETFMYNTIVERKIVLSRKLLDTIFHKNPDFVVRYLRLSKPNPDRNTRNLHPVNIHGCGDFLGALVKKRLKSFVELYEMHEKSPPAVRLSNKAAEALLKNGKEYFRQKPKLYIKLVPLKLVSAKLIESVYWKLFPCSVLDFDADKMLDYLQYYPSEKKLDLFLNSYRRVYGRNILDDWERVTFQLMRMLPAEDRIRQARIKLEKGDNTASRMDYKHCWRCYLPTKESLTIIKEEIAKTSEMECRAALICQMIYSCRVNKDDDALLDVLTYTRDRHKNEQPWFLMKVFECLLSLYDLPHMSSNHWTVLMDVIMRAVVKKELTSMNITGIRMIEAAIHYRIIYDQPIDQLISVLVDVKSSRSTGHWNILRKYPEYERMCLDACLDVFSKSYNSNEPPWKNRDGIIYDLCSSIYEFNEHHVNHSQSHKHNARIERMSVNNYPWLVKEIERIMQGNDETASYLTGSFRFLLKKHEKELCKRFCAEEKTASIADIESGEALALLKKHPESILSKWKEYLDECQEHWYCVGRQRFVRSTRWYNDIPMKFVEQCLQDLTKRKKGMALKVLAVLVHGETFTKIIEPLIPEEKTIDVHHEDAQSDYLLVHDAISGIKFANPPVPLTLIGKLCAGDYLSSALLALTNVCRRTSLMTVTNFAKMLTSQRVSVRKHGIRLMHMVASRDQLHDFLLSQWKTEEHYSIREVLFNKANDLFREEPGPATWALLSQMISTFTAKDVDAMPTVIKAISKIPDDYLEDFVKLVLKTIDNFAEAGVPQETVTKNINSLLQSINEAICNLLPEEFIEQLLRRFLFHPEQDISGPTGTFVLVAFLLPAKDKLYSRMTIFSNVFVEAVKNRWNVPHPKKSHFFPVNHAVQEIITELVCFAMHVHVDPRLIDETMKMFLSVLTPQTDATSYLLMVFAKEQMSVKTPKEFGAKLGQKLPELIAIFSPLFLFFVSDTLWNFLLSNPFKDYESEDSNLGIIEGLAETGSIEATLMAVKLLTPVNSKDYVTRYDQLVRKFTSCEHPAIRSLMCNILNKTGYDDSPDV
ncbi:uncharacterized protein LOC128878267 [Hylaeus volcanicus]|uniref:uncharacterized protein LOC128878267 n=1 Tax=Hylaeus volcanicus TaxID=313075 RepID=UPI0023B86491|nr:uncharacterized protein LOC128878267 [Hylaeus volcanicus]XP_053982301.1 uncharacterized protein LOC128878267 [Hylaeus volcanicus]